MFRTADGKWIVLGVATERQFETLASLLKFDPDQMQKYKSNELRLKNRHDLELDINLALAKLNLDLATLRVKLTELSMPFSEIHSIRTLFERDDINEIE